MCVYWNKYTTRASYAFSRQQYRSLEDYIAVSVMVQYNLRKCYYSYLIEHVCLTVLYLNNKRIIGSFLSIIGMLLSIIGSFLGNWGIA